MPAVDVQQRARTNGEHKPAVDNDGEGYGTGSGTCRSITAIGSLVKLGIIQ